MSSKNCLSTGAVKSGALAAAIAIGVVGAAGTAEAGEWTFSVTPYVWATDVGVEARLSGRKVVDEDIAVSDLIKDLDTIAQVRLEAQKGVLGAAIDLFDVTLSDEAAGVALPREAGEADLEADAGMTILDVAGFIDPDGDRMGVSFVYGVRILNERATVDAAITPATGSFVEERYETSDTFVDGLLGFRMRMPLSRHWMILTQADLSTGGTDFTWTVSPNLGYAFGSTRKYALTAGYRRMTVDFEDDGDIDTEMTLSGVVLGFSTSF
jgi:hypothetical protein